MANNVRCSICGKELDAKYMNWCPNDQLWACKKHVHYFCPKIEEKAIQKKLINGNFFSIISNKR